MASRFWPWSRKTTAPAERPLNEHTIDELVDKQIQLGVAIDQIRARRAEIKALINEKLKG
jgi:hypothetical protein